MLYIFVIFYIFLIKIYNINNLNVCVYNGCSYVSTSVKCVLCVCFRLQLIDDLSYEDVKKCYRGSVSIFQYPAAE